MKSSFVSPPFEVPNVPYEQYGLFNWEKCLHLILGDGPWKFINLEPFKAAIQASIEKLKSRRRFVFEVYVRGFNLKAIGRMVDRSDSQMSAVKCQAQRYLNYPAVSPWILALRKEAEKVRLELLCEWVETSQQIPNRMQDNKPVFLQACRFCDRVGKGGWRRCLKKAGGVQRITPGDKVFASYLKSTAVTQMHLIPASVIPYAAIQGSVVKECAASSNLIIAAFCGHQPDKLEGYLGGNQEKTFELLVRLAIGVLKKYQPTICYLNMSQGWAQAAAQACISMSVPFIACLPCTNQEEEWPVPAQARYKKLLAGAKERFYIHPGAYKGGCIEDANRYMVDQVAQHQAGGYLFTLWNKTPGRTRECLDYAINRLPNNHQINFWTAWQRLLYQQHATAQA